MNIDELFIQTLKDLKTKIESRDPYEIFMTSALLRKLLIDDDPLVNQVNRERKLKISYVINDKTAPMNTNGLQFWSIQDGFDPETSPPPLSKPINVNKEEMLKRSLMMIDGKIITVLELIKFLCHVQGSVHAGKPKDEKQKILQEIERTVSIGGMQGGARSMCAVGRVVLKGLEPLKKDILKSV